MVRKYINHAKKRASYISSAVKSKALTAKERAEIKAQIAHEHAKYHAKNVSEKFREHIATALIAAFGFVIALSWRDVITKGLEALPKSEYLQNHPELLPLYSAIITTLIAVIGILLVTKWLKKPEQ